MTLPCWDDSTRPLRTGDRYAAPSAAEASQGEHLRQIHDMYRGGLAQAVEVVALVVDGVAGVAQAREAVERVGLRVALATAGSFCGQICQSVGVHHRIEDAHLYPALRSADPTGLGAVLARLTEEHEVVDEALSELETVLTLLDGDPSQLPEVQQHIVHLQALLESHFAYEEQQLCVPLGVHRILV